MLPPSQLVLAACKGRRLSVWKVNVRSFGQHWLFSSVLPVSGLVLEGED